MCAGLETASERCALSAGVRGRVTDELTVRGYWRTGPAAHLHAGHGACRGQVRLPQTAALRLSDDPQTVQTEHYDQRCRHQRSQVLNTPRSVSDHE